MVKTFCDRCGKETTGEKHGAAPYPEVPRDLFDGTPPSTWDAISRAYFRGMVAGEHLKAQPHEAD